MLNSFSVAVIVIVVLAFVVAIFWVCYLRLPKTDKDKLRKRLASKAFLPQTQLIKERIEMESSDEESDSISIVIEEKISERKLMENLVFEKSFELIGRTNPRCSLLKASYIKAYNSSTNGVIDWHKVFTDLQRGSDGYISAIERTGRLLPYSDSYERREIYSLVDQLIKLREVELAHPNCNKFKKTQIINGWKNFKHKI